MDKEAPSGGSINPLTADEIKEQEEIFSKVLKKLAAGEGPSYSLSKISRGTIQVVSGTIVNVQAELINSKTGAKTKCNMKLWSQPWMENGYELSFNCDDKHKGVNRLSL